MKNIIKIFKTDINNIRKKRAAIVVIVALMILPSMYAWFNILPSWDPYANTADVAVAVVNNDEGTTVEGKELNVGNEVILSLLDNESMGWQFVSDEEAKEGVENGDYYASIIIPKDFSRKLASVLDEQPEKPELDYYINEKINAIAPKVTNAGASGIVENIQSGFVKVTNEAIFTAFNDIGVEIETNRLSIENLRDAVYEMEENLPEIEHLLMTADDDLEKVEESIQKANDGIKRAEDISRDTERMSERLEDMLRESDKTVRSFIPLVKKDLSLAQTVIREIPSVTRRIAQKGNDVDNLLDIVVNSTKKIDDSTEALQTLAELLKKTDDRLTGDRRLEDLVDYLNEQSTTMENLKENISEVMKTLQKGEHIGVEIIEDINKMAEDINEQLIDFIGLYEDTIIPSIQDAIHFVQNEASPEVRRVLKELETHNKELQKLVEDWAVNGGPVDLEDQKKILESIQPIVKGMKEHVGVLKHLLEHLNSIGDKERFQTSLDKVTGLHTILSEANESIEKGLALIEKGEVLDEYFWPKLNDLLLAIDEQLEYLLGEGYSNISKKFNEMIRDLEEEERNVRAKINNLQEVAEDVASLTENLLETVKNPERTLQVLEELKDKVTEGQEAIGSVIDLSQRLQRVFDDGIFLDGVDRIKRLQDDLQAFKGDVLNGVNHARNTKEEAGRTLQQLESKSHEMDRAITEMLRFIDRELMPKYESASDKADKALREGNKVLSKVNGYFPQIYDLLTQVDDGVSKGKDGLVKANEVFPDAKEKITDIANRVRILEEKGDLDQIIRLLRNDPSAESEFFSDPIVLNEHSLFPIPNYGSAMAPFFTALALWVGGLILVSSLIVDVPNKERYKSYETYFGRILTFWAIGIVQALIVTVGNMMLLKTYVAHPIWFVLFGFFISIVFVTIIYTLVSVFGNSGKVAAIILLVMQLGASGGTFPIQMTPMFFQKIHNFLPFTHALGLFRESIGGIIWPAVMTHLVWLVGYMLLFLFIGIKLKERINKSSDKFLQEARESEIIL